MKKLFMIITVITLVFALAGCKDKVNAADAALVAEAKTALLLTDLNGVTDDLTLPSSGLHDAVITWTSGNTAFIADDGSVTRPAVNEPDAVVVITATITVGEESDTKDFTVKVTALVPVLVVTITELLENTVSSGTIVEVTGVVIGIVVGAGVQISDGTGFIYVYNGSGVTFGETDVAIGDEIIVIGSKAAYFFAPQIADVTSIEFVDAGNDVPVFAETLISDLFAADYEDTLYHSNPVTVTGVLVLDGDDIYFVETDDNNDAHQVLIYYKSDTAKMAELVALEGKMVSAEVILYGFHDGYNAWRATINTTSVITSAVLTEAEEASYEISSVMMSNLSEVIGDLTLEDETDNEVAITWSTSDATVITAEGVVTRVSGLDKTATITASLTIGSTTVTKDFDLVVLDADYIPTGMAVADALEYADGAIIVIEAVVSGIIGSNTVLQDADGPAIAIYSGSFITDNGLALGDKIIIRGTKGTYYGLHQLSNTTVLLKVSSGNTVFVQDDVTLTDVAADMEGFQGFNIVMTGLIVVELDNGFGYATVKDAGNSEFVFYANSISYFDLYISVGDTLDLSVIIWDVYHDDNRFLIYEYPALGDADAVDYVSTDLTIPTTAAVDIDLPLLDTENGVAISWASDTEAVISSTGVVVQPEAGAGAATVVLTATFTKGDETETVTYTITVPEIVLGVVLDLFFSEFIEGSGYNKAIEIFNPSDATIDLSQYKILENHGDYVIETILSGTLAAGEVYVICNDQLDTGTDLDSNCDIKLAGGPDVPNFNGDDALQLVKNGVVIDQFIAEADAGTEDAAKDIYANHTFVRKATVTAGVTVFDMNEWITYDQNDFTHIGSHTYTPAP